MDALNKITDRLQTTPTCVKSAPSVLSDVRIQPEPSTCEVCGMVREYEYVGPLGSKHLYRRPKCKCDIKDEEEKERQYRQSLTRNIYRNESGLYGRLEEFRLDQLKPKPKENAVKGSITVIEAVKTAQDFISRYPDASSLIISGDVGCGKTHIACSIANSLIESLVWVRFVNLIKLFQQIKASWNQRKDVDPPSDPLPGIMQADLLILDELAELTDWQRDIFYRIVNTRYEQNKLYIVTTNIRTIEDMSAAVGSRALDRLLHRAKWIDIAASSHRLAEYAERNRRL